MTRQMANSRLIYILPGIARRAKVEHRVEKIGSAQRYATLVYAVHSALTDENSAISLTFRLVMCAKSAVGRNPV
jgi:hypothetical protein